jgi:acetyl esterase/lipase/PKD repeat protein
MKQIFILALFISVYFSSQAQTHRYTNVLFSSATKTTDVIYGSAPFINAPYFVENNTTVQNLLMDIYQPTGDVLAMRPAIIYAHPGGFLTGNKSVDDMKALCDSFARKGYVTASIDYRQGFNLISNTALHSTRAVYRALQDGRTAVRFLRANAATYGIDSNKIYFVGSSAGSFIALHSIYLDTVTEIPAQAGVNNYTNIIPPTSQTTPDLGGLDIGANLSFKGKPDAVISMWGAVQNVSLITPSNNTPVFLIHGTTDPTVPFNTGSPFGLPTLPQTSGSNPINTKLNALGFKKKDTYFVTGQGHEFYGVSNGTWSNGTGGNSYLPIIVDKSKQFLWRQHKPTANFGTAKNALNASFVDSSSGSLAWWWDLGDGATSNLKNPTHTYSAGGTYQVKLYIENDIKSWDEITKSVTVVPNNIPVANNDSVYLNDGITVVFNPRQNDTDADGDSLTITSISAVSQGILNITGLGKMATYTSANEFEGIVTAQYSISDGKGGSASSNLVFIITDTSKFPNIKPHAEDEIGIVTINTTKELSVLSNDYDLNINDSIKLGGIVIQAKNGLASITNSKISYKPNMNFLGIDSFDYSITDKKGLMDIARVYIVVIEEVKNSILNSASKSQFTIYPNPVQHSLFIESNEKMIGSSYSIQNILGLEILNGKIAKSKEEIEMKNFPKGIYFISIIGDKKARLIQKFVKD